MSVLLFLLLFAMLPTLVAHAAGAWVTPGETWERASPESQGMDSAALDAAAAYAAKYGGGAGAIVRHGYIVKEWGDPNWRADIKSATKGSFGTTLLGIAVDRGLVGLDDLARTHYPALGTGIPANEETGWLDRITIRHLATMTAGFDDGRPPKLVYEPGTSGIYSNDTSNMLAELLTLKFGEDLARVAERELMNPIGASPSGWRWRNNAYRNDTVGGIKSREFASGITINYETLARIGYLYLRGGVWNGRRILSEAFLREALRPTDLPAPWEYYAFYWGSNERGTYDGMPRDTYWALGLGDSFVLFCPSLDLVAVRLGLGSKRSHLPGPEGRDDWADDWGGRVEGFFRQVVDAVRDPYPASPVVERVVWDPPKAILRQGEGSDNWPLTWADDDALYTAYGDGWGFEPKVEEKLSLGIGKVLGSPPNFRGVNLRSPDIERKGDGKSGPKASGILMVDGVLYLWIRNTGNSQLAWSEDHGATWTWSDWKFTTSFGAPTFLNFGRNYAGARDDYVYVVSPDAEDAYTPADRMVMARVPKDAIRDRSAYEFFRGLDAEGNPLWTANIEERGAVFEHPGRAYRSGFTFSPGLGRYLWVQIVPGEADMRFEGGFGIYDAPEPWGPWTTVYFTERWDVGPGESSSFPTKWISPDGRTAHLVFSGEDAFSVRKVRFETGGPRTRVSIEGDRWFLNGEVTYPGSPAEGRLMNVRMVNATFEDRNREDFDPDANTNRFIARIPEYAAHGVRAFTLNLQGGMPGYEGALNSAFRPDGSFRPSYLERIRRVIEVADRYGIVVILGFFYQRQDQVLESEDAVREGALNAARWIQGSGFTNVVVEIANEYGHPGFDHPLLKTPEGQVELIRLVKEAVPNLLVSTSDLGHGRTDEEVAKASDFILIHFNSVPVEEIPARIAGLKEYGKPIVCNEDDKVGEEAAEAARLSVENGASWGFMAKEVNQFWPFVFDGAADDPAVYAMLKALTSPNE